jgi:hypothetical protein
MVKKSALSFRKNGLIHDANASSQPLSMQLLAIVFVFNCFHGNLVEPSVRNVFNSGSGSKKIVEGTLHDEVLAISLFPVGSPTQPSQLKPALPCSDSIPHFE